MGSPGLSLTNAFELASAKPSTKTSVCGGGTRSARCGEREARRRGRRTAKVARVPVDLATLGPGRTLRRARRTGLGAFCVARVEGEGGGCGARARVVGGGGGRLVVRGEEALALGWRGLWRARLAPEQGRAGHRLGWWWRGRGARGLASDAPRSLSSSRPLAPLARPGACCHGGRHPRCLDLARRPASPSPACHRQGASARSPRAPGSSSVVAHHARPQAWDTVVTLLDPHQDWKVRMGSHFDPPRAATDAFRLLEASSLTDDLLNNYLGAPESSTLPGSTSLTR